MKIHTPLTMFGAVYPRHRVTNQWMLWVLLVYVRSALRPLQRALSDTLSDIPPTLLTVAVALLLGGLAVLRRDRGATARAGIIGTDTETVNTDDGKPHEPRTGHLAVMPPLPGPERPHKIGNPNDDANGTSLAAQFRQLVQKLGTEGGPGTFWASLHDTRFAGLQCVFYRVTGGILTLVNGKSDRILNEYGQRFGLPRGCAVVWDPDRLELLAAGGFFAKFENDSRAEHGIAASFGAAVEITFFRKYSGFLSGVLLYKERPARPVRSNRDQPPRWIVLSKKSADPTPYVEAGARLWGDVLTTHALTALWNRGVRALYGECLAAFDQTHGARVFREQIVLTCLCEHIGADTSSPVRHATDALRRLAFRAGLPQSIVDKAVVVPRDKVCAFLEELHIKRNFMTETCLQTILRGLSLPDASMHMEVSGDVLEGLVLVVRQRDGTVLTQKYKFPVYNVRTFLLRAIGYRPARHSAAAAGSYRCLGVTGGDGTAAWRPTSVFARAINDWVQRWVVDDRARDTWRAIALAMGEEYDRLIGAETGAEHATLAPPPSETPSQSRPWILAADCVQTRVDAGEAFAQLSARDVEHLAEAHRKTATVYVILGPVGAGKSTAGRQLAARLGCEHVDGDELLGVSAQLWGAERNAGTVSAVAYALASDGAAVVSAGGGALGAHRRTKWRFTLPDHLQALFPELRVEVVVCLPSQRAGADAWELLPTAPTNAAIDQLYATCDDVETTVRDRVRRREWSVPPRQPKKASRKSSQPQRNDPRRSRADAAGATDEASAADLTAFVRTIIQVSKRNAQFAKMMVRGSDDESELSATRAVLTYPRACTATGTQASIPDAVVEALGARPRAPRQQYAIAGQMRMVYLVDDRVRHETCVYSQVGHRVALPCPPVSHRAPETVTVRRVVVPGERGCELCLLPDRGRATDQHLTVRPGTREGTAGKPVPRRPFHMRHVARALREKRASVDLGDGDIVSLHDCTVTAEAVQQLGWIMIPPLD